jgi:hypothetical protein
MQIAYLDPLDRAIERMKGLLMRPFDPVKWLVIGFVAWLSGLAGGAGGGMGRLNLDDAVHRRNLGLGALREELSEIVWVLPLLLLGAMVVIGLVLLLLWVSSRAKLVFVDQVVTGRAAVVEPWRRLGRLGDSLFLWRLGFAVACLTVAVLVVVGIAGPALYAGSSDVIGALSIAGMVSGGLLLALVGLVAFVVSFVLDAFVVPLMYRYRIPATEAWRALLPWLSAYPGHFLLYLLLVIGLAIVFGALFAVLCLLSCCILALPYVGTVLLLPVWVTYRLVSLEFLAQFDPGLDVFRVPAVAESSAGE